MENEILRNGEVLVFRDGEPREHVCCDCGLRYMVTLEVQDDGMAIHATFVRTERVLEKIAGMSRGKTKELVHDFIRNNEGASYADLQEGLGLDLETIVDICSELSKEGSVEEDVVLE